MLITFNVLLFSYLEKIMKKYQFKVLPKGTVLQQRSSNIFKFHSAIEVSTFSHSFPLKL